MASRFLTKSFYSYLALGHQLFNYQLTELQWPCTLRSTDYTIQHELSTLFFQ